MTNAEKFKEVFGFNLNIQAFSEGDICPFVSEKCRELPCPDCINNYWQSEYQGTPTISLSVIEKIHDAIDNADSDGYLEDEHGNYIGSVLTSQHVNEIIDKAVKEIKHECSY